MGTTKRIKFNSCKCEYHDKSSSFRVPSNVFDKWRQALLSHAASSQIDAYVKPVHRSMDHLSEVGIVFVSGQGYSYLFWILLIQPTYSVGN